MGISTRPADDDDVNFLARIMERSMLPAQGQGLFDELAQALDMDRISFHEALLQAEASNWGQISDFIVVEHDGRPAGATASHLSNMDDVRPITMGQINLLAKHLELPADKARSLLQASISKSGAFGDTPHFRDPAEYVVEFAAVLPEFSGLGLSRYFFGAHVKRAMERGCKTLGTRALVGNQAALHAWEKLGLRHHSTIPADQIAGDFVGIHRFTLDLAGLPDGYMPGAPLPYRQ
jgi:GNAT superfamily N-acetyltransferase